MRLLGPALVAACDQHRKDNLQRRRIGRRTRSFAEFGECELGVTLGEEHHEEEDQLEGQLTFPVLAEVLDPTAGPQLAGAGSARGGGGMSAALTGGRESEGALPCHPSSRAPSSPAVALEPWAALAGP